MISVCSQWSQNPVQACSAIVEIIVLSATDLCAPFISVIIHLNNSAKHYLSCHSGSIISHTEVNVVGKLIELVFISLEEAWRLLHIISSTDRFLSISGIWRTIILKSSICVCKRLLPPFRFIQTFLIYKYVLYFETKAELRYFVKSICLRKVLWV